MMDKTILCVILHYGNEDVTWECVESIIDHNLLDILIADNDPKQELTIPQDYIGKVKIFKTGGTAGLHAQIIWLLSLHVNIVTIRYFF